MSKWIILCLFGLVGCTSAKIDRSVISFDETGRKVSEEKCTAEYSNASFGTFDGKEIHGCDAGGSSQGVDNSQLITVPLSVLQSFYGGVAK